MKRHDGIEGFTLVEMLVALSLTSLLAALLTGVIPQLRMLQRLSADNDADMTVQAVANYIADEIAVARRLPILPQHSNSRMALKGTPASISFVGVTRTGSDRFALRDISITQGDGDDSDNIVRQDRGRRAAHGMEPTVHIISKGKIGFTFCPTIKSMDEKACEANWNRERLPGIVKFTITPPGTNSRPVERTVLLPNAD
jgi:general secretion pathway protein J